jgi:hypothetical protein
VNGSYHQAYFERAWSEDWDANIREQTPQDLCLKKDQHKVWEQNIAVLWIRTWYGHSDSGASDASREAADAGYRRLWQKGFVDLDVVRHTLPLLKKLLTADSLKRTRS